MPSNGDILAGFKGEASLKVHDDADKIWRPIVKSEMGKGKKSSGETKKKLQCFEYRTTTAEATK